MRCRMCGKVLTDPESMARGFGPKCWAELHPAVQQTGGGTGFPPEEVPVLPGQMDIFDYLGGTDDDGRENGSGQRGDAEQG